MKRGNMMRREDRRGEIKSKTRGGNEGGGREKMSKNRKRENTVITVKYCKRERR